MRRVAEADVAQLIEFLTQHQVHMMFALSNLLKHGLDGDHPRGTTFWMNEAQTDVIGITNEGMVMPYCPSVAGMAPELLAGRSIAGLLGKTDFVERIRQSLKLGAGSVDEEEPHFTLTLTDLVMPKVDGLRTAPLSEAPRDLIVGWRKSYMTEVLPVPGEDIAQKAERDVSVYLEANSHRVLFADGAPVAMTGFNATAPRIAQIGGVYTPPENRRKGLGRAAVALHLNEARANGVESATLFAASVPAARCYRSIGFKEIGRFSIVLFETPQKIPAEQL